MSKITLNNVGSLIDATTAQTTINNNFAVIQTAMDNTLSRNGLAPNTIATPIDVNSNRIVNLPAPITANEPLRLIDLNTFVGGGTVSSLPAGGVTGDSLLKTSSVDYAVGWSTPSIPTAQIANNAVTNAKAAQMAAFTIKGNATGSTANATDISIPALTQKVSPVSGDFVMIADSAASNALKYSTIGGIAAIGSVSSIDAKTGTFTTGNGLDSTGGNVIELTPARRTLPTIQTFITPATSTYTTPSNCLWIEIYCQAGGGGGGGAASGSTQVGTVGGSSAFAGVQALGGGPAAASSGSNASALGGAGGTGGAGTATRRMAGTPGTAINQGLTGQTASPTGAGGSGGLMGGGAPGISIGNATGTAGGANTGGGGSGGANIGSNYSAGAGGGGGEAFYLIINSPAASYAYTVGAGGPGGTGGAFAGGAGGSGYIQVIEHYGT